MDISDTITLTPYKRSRSTNGKPPERYGYPVNILDSYEPKDWREIQFTSLVHSSIKYSAQKPPYIFVRKEALTGHEMFYGRRSRTNNLFSGVVCHCGDGRVGVEGRALREKQVPGKKYSFRRLVGKKT
ncbi:hypothetical protein CEXT_484741 [Caerostris extrusa]|uniref:Uncharacterized protein n=1 Tax=Caerostris extrusa TaxID=172846 RepID=A0AAV4QE03_CAEEX|nr:hypothetical protein CEXT_484741 [Caerostris extrusa]